ARKRKRKRPRADSLPLPLMLDQSAAVRPRRTRSGGGMKLFVGLGNPGQQYAGNRHNIGYMAVGAIAAAHGFPAWRARFQGLTSEGRLGPEKVLLLKPGTYMNLSGDSVGAAARFYKLAPADIVVFHDEL